MPIFVAASAAFVAMSQRICRPAGRRAGVGRPAISNIFDAGHRLDARRPADATIFGTHISDARPMPYDVRPMQNRPAGRLSEFPVLHEFLTLHLFPAQPYIYVANEGSKVCVIRVGLVIVGMVFADRYICKRSVEGL